MCMDRFGLKRKKPVPLDWQTRVLVSIFRKDYWRLELQEDHTPQPPWYGLVRGAGEESLSVSQISDSGGAVWFLPRPWNSGLALHP